jgi:ADP-ribose pyrophosphatase YjhB (NUDIX family)
MKQEEWEKTVQWVGIVAGCVIKQDGKYLLVQEKQQKVYGLWNLPAGYVDKGEEIEVAAVREAKEESGFDVELDSLIAIYHNTANEPVKHAYKAHIVGGELAVQEDEILDVKWMTYQEVEELNSNGKIRARWIFDAITSVENNN